MVSWHTTSGHIVCARTSEAETVDKTPLIPNRPSATAKLP